MDFQALPSKCKTWIWYLRGRFSGGKRTHYKRSSEGHQITSKGSQTHAYQQGKSAKVGGFPFLNCYQFPNGFW